MTTATEQQTGTSATAETAEAATTTDFWAQVQAVDLSAISEETVNFYTLEEGDTILGDASDTVRRLHVIASQEAAKLFNLRREIRRKVDEHLDLHERSGNSGADHDCKGFYREFDLLMAEVRKLEKRARHTKGIFWASVKLDFPELEGKGSMFLAHGWKIGYQKESLDDVARVLVVSSMFGEPSGFPPSDSRGAWMDRLFRRSGRRGE